MIKVSYTVMCKNDVSKAVSLSEILANEKIEKAIKSEFTKGLRNLVLSYTCLLYTSDAADDFAVVVIWGVGGGV